MEKSIKFFLFFLISFLFISCSNNQEVLLNKCNLKKDGVSCSNIAVKYLKEKNEIKSFEYFKKACDFSKLAHQCFFVATHYFIGKGVEKDISKACEYFDIACDEGSLYACNTLTGLDEACK